MTSYAYRLPRSVLQVANNARIENVIAIGLRDAERDERWPAIVGALAALREAGRFSIRIVDADCGAGALLLCAVRHARRLGFTAIEARGIDGAPALITQARAAAKRLHDAAAGIDFAVADLVAALGEEADLPADIVIWHGRAAGTDQRAVAAVVAAAGRTVIADPSPAARA